MGPDYSKIQGLKYGHKSHVPVPPKKISAEFGSLPPAEGLAEGALSKKMNVFEK